MFFLCSGKQNVLRQVKPMSCVSRQTEVPGGSPEHSDTAAPGITWDGCAWEEGGRIPRSSGQGESSTRCNLSSRSSEDVCEC